jgi:hypothetical protein
MKYLVCTLFVLLAISSVAHGQAQLRVSALDAALLQQAKTRISAKNAALLLVLEKLRREADKALKAEAFSVTQKERVPPSGDKHDYLSLAPYWWPDPKSRDGLPYIRRDGETNPDSKRGTDANIAGKMAETVETLALAYYFTGDERYAGRAALMVRTWFLNAETKMNPNMRSSQAIPGRNEGRGAGLIESRHFIRVVDAVGLMGSSRAWTQTDQEALIAWFREFIKWMQNSPNGRDEADARNNHGSWYAAQLAAFALFIGDDKLVRKTVEAAQKRIARQIEPDGKQPEELQRTRGLWYSGFNLEALFLLAEIGKQVGVDLYGYQTKDGRSLRRGIDYIATYADPARQWPHLQINEVESARRELAYLLRRAALAYREPKYEQLLKSYLSAESERQIWQLLWVN